MSLSAAALVALALAAAAPPADGWRVEAPLLLTASGSSSNVETQLLPWAGLRVGRLHALSADPAGPSAGFDAAVLGGGLAREGTPQISATRLLGVLEGRGLWSPARVTSTWTAFLPYGFAGALAGLGASHVAAFEDTRTRAVATWGLRAGGGLELLIHGVTTRIELGAGMRDLRFELSGALSLGFAL